MKVVKSFLMVVVACIAMACSKPSEKIFLFNGENLAGWNSVLQEGEDGTEAVNVFSVVDGNIRIEGNPFGYM